MTDPKNIIHFDTGRGWRGGQNQVYLLIRELKKCGINQTLIAPGESPLIQKIRETGIDTYELDPRNDIDLKAVYKLKKYVKKISPDIIHLHSAKSLGIAFFALSNLLFSNLKIKKIFTRRVDFPLKKNLLNSLKYNFPDRMAVISDFIKEQLVSGGFKEPARIYSAVESKKYKTSCNYNLQNKIIKIGMAGELDLKHKDYLTFIKVAQRIIKDKPFQEIKFYIAGKGKDKDKIKNYIRKKGLENHIKMEGFIADIRTFYAKLDILLHTVRFEGLGTVIIQAMASGLPVVATRTGGIPEIIEDGKNGFLAEKTNERDVAKKLKILIGNPKIREKIGVNGKNTVKIKFSAENMAKEYLKLYSEDI